MNDYNQFQGQEYKYTGQNSTPGKFHPNRGQVKNISTGYVPRPLQHKLHNQLRRFNVLVCHRRFGKTVFSINEMIDKGLKNNLHNPQYAYIAPTYKQARMIAWEYLKQYTENLPGVEVRKGDLSVVIHRPGVPASVDKRTGKVLEWKKRPDKITFMLLGADNPDSLRGLYLDGCIMDEYAQCDPIIWGQIVRPALSDRRGWAIFIGTPKGQNHFYHRYKKALQADGWFVQIYRAHETGIIPPDELADLRLDLTQDEYEQEMECSFTAAILGSYYGHILNHLRDAKQIGRFPYNPRFPVDTFWDLGHNDALCIVFRQKIGPNYYYIDYFEDSGKGLDWYAKIIKDKNYNYGRHVLPWDGKAHDLGTGLTRQETLRNLGIRTEIQKRQYVDDRIQATRTRLKVSFIDELRCERLLECLQNYQKEWDAKLMRFKDKPLHDWSSNGSDAYGYSALDDRESQFAENRFGRYGQKSLRVKAKMDYNEI
jgi:hypothetical protein